LGRADAGFVCAVVTRGMGVASAGVGDTTIVDEEEGSALLAL
jgi:hypothetical protein